MEHRSMGQKINAMFPFVVCCYLTFIIDGFCCLLPLTEHGRNLLASRRKTLAAVSAVVVAGGTYAYMQSRQCRRLPKSGNSSNDTASREIGESLSQNGPNDQSVQTTRSKRKGLKSVHVLAAVLLSRMGPNGTRNLILLVTTAVLRTALSHRLAKVQGFLFRAAFLRRVPMFLRLIIENLLLCFLQSALYSTSKYLTGALGLRFRKILTELIHADYFEMVESRFRELLEHCKIHMRNKWLYGILDEFITKQLPHNVTWGLSLLYALEHKGDRALTSTQGELAHALRFLASVVSQSFLAFGDILELHKKFLELSGGINRIFELDELLDAAQSEASLPDTAVCTDANGLPAQDIISFCEVDIITPSQKLLARRLTCDIVQGKSLLVTGPNGSGKSSIFRALRGLWPVVSGRLLRPCSSVFYVPQRPYTSLGTLRDQIIYPLSREEAERRMITVLRTGDRSDASRLLDAHLESILEDVRLVYLLEREGWDATTNWEDVLSLGEQQRLGMARLFFHHPKYGVLDECTNATSVDVEEHLFRLAREMGITVITSSQRPALIPFHSLELKLIDGEGKWELCAINQ
ncbi:ABC transporter D family member 1-like [Canna indica]|uniref:ABC transporter D family member 1-like n=1 Tax=Canna indica TaxID=4628 RepID=A0AAQ3QPI4_9LILI|nr:ABC transporter D family member 1-like [Canna indica]